MPAQDLLVGALIAGRYLVEKRLGMGGMGAVYLAHQESLGRAVALKVLRGELVGDPVAVERFKNEAKVIAQLGHPHIVGIHDFGTTPEGLLFIAMEYLPGETLAEALKSGGPLPWPRAAAVVRDVTRALAAAHRRGVVHRDLKPDNVVLVEAAGVGDFVKVLDFGIAKLVRGHEVAPNLTGTGLVPGTPGYIAPEQITGAEDDPRSDLYAVGVTFFEMLTGRRPFEGATAMKIFLQQLEGEAPPIRQLLPTAALPEPVAALVTSLLARDPAGRPASAEALLARIDELGDIPRLAVTPPAGSSGLGDDALSLHPDLPTLPATTTPAAPVPVDVARAEPAAASTPSTGTSPTGLARSGSPSSPPSRGLGKKHKLVIAAAAVAAVVLSSMLVTVTFLEGGFLAEVERRNPLPVLSGDAELRARLGDALGLLYHGDVHGADKAVDSLLQSGPDEPSLWLLKGVLAGRRCDWFGEEEAYAKVSALSAERSVHGYYDAARALFDTVPRASVGSAEDVVELWRACADCKTTELGYIAFNTLLLNPYTRDVDAGLEIATEALAKHPSSAVAHADKARFLVLRRDVEGALAVVGAGLMKHPTCALMHHVAAEVHLSAGRYDEAERELALAGFGDVDVEVARLKLYALRGGPGDEARRQQHLEVLLGSLPPAAAATLALEHAATLASVGRRDAARELYRRALARALDERLAGLAAFIVLEALKSADALQDAEMIGQLAASAVDVLALPELPNTQRLILSTVIAMLPAMRAAEAGDLAPAAGALARFDALESVKSLPRSAKMGIRAYTEWRVLAHDPAQHAKARALTRYLGHRCRMLDAEARIARAGPDRAAERAAWQRLLDDELYCKANDYGGGFVLGAYASLAELEAAAGNQERALELTTRALAAYPLADASLSHLGRLRAVRDRLEGRAPPPASE